MTSRFAACLPLILAHEGGYVDHPSDPGGATNLGVTIGVLSEWLGRHATKAEVRALTKESVAPIYEKNYWQAAGCDKLPKGVDYLTFDIAVNSGVKRAKRFLQEAAGVVADGAIGPKTLAAIEALGPEPVIRRMSTRRAAFFKSLSTFPTFGKGWMRRCLESEAKALEMAR